MSRIIGVLNYKGGTGKTTTVVNVGAGLALQGKRILCIDLDAQGSLATYLGVDYTHTLAHLLVGQMRPQACIVRARDNLDLIASDSSLLQAEGKMWRIGNDRAVQRLLTNQLRDIDEEYDYVFLDFSPSSSLIGESGLLYARELIVPVSMSYLALVGLRQVIERLKALKEIPGSRARLYLILPTLYTTHQRQDREVVQTLQRHFDHMVADPIRTNVKITEAPSHHMSIYEYAPHSVGAVDYAHLAERVLQDG
jgi:chromosome partitioning protein